MQVEFKMFRGRFSAKQKVEMFGSVLIVPGQRCWNQTTHPIQDGDIWEVKFEDHLLSVAQSYAEKNNTPKGWYFQMSTNISQGWIKTEEQVREWMSKRI